MLHIFDKNDILHEVLQVLVNANHNQIFTKMASIYGKKATNIRCNMNRVVH